MSTRAAPVTIGDATLIVTYEVHGAHAPATMIDPEEWPEIELKQLVTPAGEDVSGLLEFSPLYELALEQVTRSEHDDWQEMMADEAYDRWRDERLEDAR